MRCGGQKHQRVPFRDEKLANQGAGVLTRRPTHSTTSSAKKKRARQVVKDSGEIRIAVKADARAPL